LTDDIFFITSALKFRLKLVVAKLKTNALSVAVRRIYATTFTWLWYPEVRRALSECLDRTQTLELSRRLSAHCTAGVTLKCLPMKYPLWER